MLKIVIGLVLLILPQSCQQNIEPDAQLLGTWVWVSSSGGFAGNTLTPASTGEQIVLEITKSKIIKYINGSVDDASKYNIQLGESIFESSQVKLIITSQNIKQSYILTNSTLTLRDECYDCYQHEYIKEY